MLGHEDVAAQGLLGAEDQQHERDPGEGGQGEAPPVPPALEQDRRLAQQPGQQRQRREPDQQDHDQQQAVGGRLAGGSWDGLAGGGLPAAGRVPGVGAVHETPPWRVSAGSWCQAPRAAGRPGWDVEGGCAGTGWPGSRRPPAGRSRRCAASDYGGAGSRPPVAGRRPCGSARPRPRPASGAGRRPRRTAPIRRWRRGRRGAGWRRRGRGSCRLRGAARALRASGHPQGCLALAPAARPRRCGHGRVGG